MNTKEAYQYASGVDIDSVYVNYDEDRAIGYEGEYALFSALLTTPYFDNSKLLTNLVIPTGVGDKTTELDMVLITENGIIVFEVKNYKGTIYGKTDEKYWTQYFRTVKNNRFLNPVKQNAYHVKALSSLYSGQIHSVVIFTSSNCDIRRVESKSSSCKVADIHSLPKILQEISQREKVLRPEEIDNLFGQLKGYSSSKEPKELYVDNKCKNLNDLKEQLSKDVKSIETACKKEYTSLLGRNVKFISVMAIIVCLLTIIVSCGNVNRYKNISLASQKERDNATKLYNEMYSKFSKVSEDDMTLSNSILTISELTAIKHDYLEAITLSFKITNNTESSSITFKKNKSVLIVELKDGTVEEYQIESGTIYPYEAWGKTRKFNITINHRLEDISYMKISPVYLVVTGKSDREFAINIYQK